MNHEMTPDGNINYTQNPMTVEEFMFALNLVNQVASDDYDGSLGSVDRTLCLSRALLESPATFWEVWQLEMGGDYNRELREKAIEFVQQSGFTGSLEQMRQFTESV